MLLEEALGASAEMWMRLQAAYDIARARERLLGRPRRAPAETFGPELASSPVDPPPDPLDELLEDYPIGSLAMKREAELRGERIKWLQKAALDAADEDTR